MCNDEFYTHKEFSYCFILFRKYFLQFSYFFRIWLWLGLYTLLHIIQNAQGTSEKGPGKFFEIHADTKFKPVPVAAPMFAQILTVGN